MREFTASDGVRIRYRDEGRGTPLLLLHGLMAHGGFFRAQAELADSFRLITPDLRGHGGSRCPGAAPRLSDLENDVEALCAHLDLQGVIGVGWSLGASLLWRILAGEAGWRFAGSVVIDMTPCVRNRGGWTLGLTAEHCAARTEAMTGDYHDFAVAAGSAIFADADGAHRDLADWASFEFARNDPDVIAAIWASLEAEDSRHRLAGIEQPTLIVHGADSPLYSDATAAHLCAALPNATRARFERSGHAPHLEEPARFNRLLRTFAAGLARPPALIPQRTT